MVDTWQVLQNLGILNLGWILPTAATIIFGIIRERDKRIILRKIFYPAFKKRFKVSIDAEIKFPEFYEDTSTINAINENILADFPTHGIKISRHEYGHNYIEFWINSSQAAYKIELMPDIEDGDIVGTQVIIKLLNTLTFRYKSNENRVYIDILEQLVDIIEKTIKKPDFKNYHLQAMLSDSGVAGNIIDTKDEPKPHLSSIYIRTNGLEGDSENAQTLIRLCLKYLPLAPPAWVFSSRDTE